jgi:hypothetical protein
MIYRSCDLSELTFYRISEECAIEFIDFRIKIKKPLTQRAFKMALKEALRCEELGITAEEAIDLTVYWGWQGVDFDFIKKKLADKKSANNTAIVIEAQKSLAHGLTDRSWADGKPLRLS